jgi:hypothetical protein
MASHFLFMDEKYAEQSAPAHARATSLTGILIPTSKHREFRAGFYKLVNKAIGDPDGLISPMPVIHAMALLPGTDDDTKFNSLEGLVSLINNLEFRTYRVGYRPTSALLALPGMTKQGIVGLCFMGMLGCLKEALTTSVIWPVMEIDQTAAQDRAFAGMLQNADYLTARLGASAMSLDNENLGEVLYTTKRSAYGSTVDCVAYLLDAKFLRTIGQPLTPFKARLADIASGLDPTIAFDEVIEIRFENPPAGYLSNGPARFMFPIIPKD